MVMFSYLLIQPTTCGNECEGIPQSQGQPLLKRHKKMMIIHNFIDRDKSGDKIVVGHKP